MSVLTKEITKADSTVQMQKKGKDILVKSKDRNTTKLKVEKQLKKAGIAFKSVFKKGKSNSIDVLEIAGEGDLIFKPLTRRGAGGVAFEKQLENDIKKYLNGAEYNQLKHPDVLKEMEKVLGFNRRTKYEVVPEGSKNQKRKITFTSDVLHITNSTGQTLTDLTLKHDRKLMYLSLKMSPTYYIMNSGIGTYFMEGRTKIKINEFFGFNGQKMGGFGRQFACVTKKPNYEKVKVNLANLIAQAIGTDVIIIHKKTLNDVLVSEIGRTNIKVKIGSLKEESYSYPEKKSATSRGRKYANIKFDANINKHDYIVNMQFRGTTATDIGPKYIRILLERL